VAVNAGHCRAAKLELTARSRQICQSSSRPLQRRAASASVQRAEPESPRSIARRRSQRSTNAPASGERTMTGSITQSVTRAKRVAEPVRW
jgi:hypothetical protein